MIRLVAFGAHPRLTFIVKAKSAAAHTATNENLFWAQAFDIVLNLIGCRNAAIDIIDGKGPFANLPARGTAMLPLRRMICVCLEAGVWFVVAASPALLFRSDIQFLHMFDILLLCIRRVLLVDSMPTRQSFLSCTDLNLTNAFGSVVSFQTKKRPAKITGKRPIVWLCDGKTPCNMSSGWC